MVIYRMKFLSMSFSLGVKRFAERYFTKDIKNIER